MKKVAKNAKMEETKKTTAKKTVAKKSAVKETAVKKTAVKKSKAKSKETVDDVTFEEKVFENDKKVKKVKVEPKKTNIIPIVVGLLCVVCVVGVIFISKNKNFFSIETKKIEVQETTETTETTTIPIETTTEALTIKADTTTLQQVMPYYDSDIYSEGAMYSFDEDTLLKVKDEIDNLEQDEVYIKTVDEGKKDVLANNKLTLNNYLDSYSMNNKSDYDKTVKRDYINDIINSAKEKKGKFYHSDFVSVFLFAQAKDKGFYYEVPSSLYKKVTIKKYAFDKMNVGDKGSISLPLGANGSLVATEVVKEDESNVSYIDANGDTKILELVEKSDIEYALINEDTGAYVVVEYLNKDIAVLKNARIGHGKDMEYIAYNYLKYPAELNFEVHVKAEDIVNKTSSNNMLNGQFINSSKQIWDEKGFVVSLIYFER